MIKFENLRRSSLAAIAVLILNRRLLVGCWLIQLLNLAHLELLGTVGSVEDDAVLGVLDYMSCIDHLTQKISGALIVSGLLACGQRNLLGCLNAVTKVCQILKVSCNLFLSSDLLLLVLLDLCLGAPPLVVLLHHVGALALAH